MRGFLEQVRVNLVLSVCCLCGLGNEMNGGPARMKSSTIADNHGRWRHKTKDQVRLNTLLCVCTLADDHMALAARKIFTISGTRLATHRIRREVQALDAKHVIIRAAS